MSRRCFGIKGDKDALIPVLTRPSRGRAVLNSSARIENLNRKLDSISELLSVYILLCGRTNSLLGNFGEQALSLLEVDNVPNCFEVLEFVMGDEYVVPSGARDGAYVWLGGLVLEIESL